MTSPIIEATCPHCGNTVHVWLDWRKSTDSKYAHECHTHIMPAGCDHYRISPSKNGASIDISFGVNTVSNANTGTSPVLDDLSQSLGRLEEGVSGLKEDVREIIALQRIANGKTAKHAEWIAAHEKAEAEAARREDRQMKLIAAAGVGITILTNLGPITQFFKQFFK